MSGAPTPDRVVAGLALAYDVDVVLHGRKLRFAPGSLTWDRDARIRMLRDHDHSQRLGRAIDLDNTRTGIAAALAVDRGRRGDRALARIADGTERGLSAGVEFLDVVRLQAGPGGVWLVRRAVLQEISLTASPRIDVARVTAWPGSGQHQQQPN